MPRRPEAPRALPTIRWAFWDLGDTLLNEDRLRYHIYERLLWAMRRAHPEITFADLLERRACLIGGGDKSPHYTIAWTDLSPEEYALWTEEIRHFVAGEGQMLLNPVPGAVETLRHLAGRYRMGIIADQPHTVEETLGRLGIRERFDVIALNSVAGCEKSDGRLFRWALREAGCDASEAVMVGNRTDVDIAPARRIGMRAILCVFSPAEKGCAPDAENARLYIEALARTPNWPATPDLSAPDEAPDACVRAMAEIPPLLSRWDA